MCIFESQRCNTVQVEKQNWFQILQVSKIMNMYWGGALIRAISSNLSLLLFLFPSWPGCGTPSLPYWLPALARSQPYSPLVQSRFLPWLTGSYISNWFNACGLLIALMIEAARTSETLVNFYQTTWRYNPKDSHLHTNRRENLKLYLTVYS
jgi:hypothetical protein